LILPISASQVARIIGRSRKHLAFAVILRYKSGKVAITSKDLIFFGHTEIFVDEIISGRKGKGRCRAAEFGS
jgi:hypothetical protein